MLELKTINLKDCDLSDLFFCDQTVYYLDTPFAIDVISGDELTIYNTKPCTMNVHKNDVSLIPETEDFKKFISEVILIKKYETKGEINRDLSDDNAKTLDEYIKSYFVLSDLDETYFNGEQYLAIHPDTLSGVDYDIETGVYYVVIMEHAFETKSLEAAFKMAYEFNLKNK